MNSKEKIKTLEYLDSSSLEASDVKIDVFVEPMEHRMDVFGPVFLFNYNVKITNESSVGIQLLNRHWKVFSAGRQVADIKGDGVVGHQPFLNPLESFQYSSYTLINDPVGEMRGSYTFVTRDGIFFDQTIPVVKLAFTDPSILH